jgi:prepilin-type N-terminal cleavage/methylation domain-containing protein
MKKKITKNKGFTLIELLVVIAIISLLSTVILASLNEARAKAEDSKVIQEVTSFQQAVALFVDEEGHYPNPGTSCSGSNPEVCCIGGPDVTCYLGGVGINPIDLSGTEFATIIDNYNHTTPTNLASSSLIKTANATTLNEYIEYGNIGPQPIYQAYGTSIGGGLMYRYYGPDTAEVLFTTNNVVNKGDIFFEGGYVRKQPADNWGSVSGS